MLDGLLGQGPRYGYEGEDDGEPLLMPGVSSLLDLLDKRHIPRAILASDAQGAAFDALSGSALADRFDCMKCYDGSGTLGGFDKALCDAITRIGVVPELCLVIASAEEEARAAMSVGLRVIWVNNHQSRVKSAELSIADASESAPTRSNDVLAALPDHASVRAYLTLCAR